MIDRTALIAGAVTGVVLGPLVRLVVVHRRGTRAEPSIPADPLNGFTDDEVSRAALEFVYSSSFSAGTIARCDAADERIRQERIKYAGFEPVRMRKHIIKWLDYYQARVNRDRRDIETQERVQLALAIVKKREPTP